MTLKKGDRVYRYYSCEPAFIYGGGRHREEGVVIDDPFDHKNKLLVAVEWDCFPHPDPSFVSQGPSQ